VAQDILVIVRDTPAARSGLRMYVEVVYPNSLKLSGAGGLAPVVSEPRIDAGCFPDELFKRARTYRRPLRSFQVEGMGRMMTTEARTLSRWERRFQHNETRFLL